MILSNIPAFLAAAFATVVGSASAESLRPYTADPNTLFLFHLNETASGSTTSNSGTRGGNAYSVNMSSATATPPLVTTSLQAEAYPGFGNSAQFSSNALIGWDYNASGAYQGEVNGTSPSADRVPGSVFDMNGNTSPFTIECMIYSTLDTLNSQQNFLSAESSTPRGMRFSLNNGTLQFEAVTGSGIWVSAPVPASGANAYAANTWFHVAMSFDGTTARLYWTKVDPAFDEASLLASAQVTPGSAAYPSSFGTDLRGGFVIGGENRAADNEYFRGRVDEVRVSNICRQPDEFIFVGPPDTDHDGLPDAWEMQHFGQIPEGSLSQDAAGDYDHDSFTQAQELAGGSNPNKALSVPGDIDGDGLPDTWEIENFGTITATDSTADPDGDGRSNSAEQSVGTDPNDPLSFPGAAADPAKPTGMMVDLLAFPGRTTVADTRPEFTWIFNQRKRGESQTAYEIIVSSTAALAGAGSGNVWSSGKVSAASSVNVECAVTLVRGSTYHWRVRTWSDAGAPSTWSAIQKFTVEPTAPLTGARTIAESSANPWAGRYQPAFDTSVAPVVFLNKGGGNYFIDFGKDAMGCVTLHLNGSFQGQSVTVKFCEIANVSNNGVGIPPAGSFIRQSQTTVALKNGDITYEVRPNAQNFLNYWGTIDISGWAGNVSPFRYVELVGCPGTVTASDIRQKVLHVPFDDNAAAFESSNATLDAVWDLCHHTIKATSYIGMYVDGDRERTPYEADSYINQLAHYGVDREYTTARYTYEYLLDHKTWPSEWSWHMVLMAWADYMNTGNSEALAANYAALQGFLLLSPTVSTGRRTDGLYQGTTVSGSGNWPTDIIDWPGDLRDGYEMTRPVKTATSAFQYRALALMQQIATILGNTTDAASYQSQATATQNAINLRLWDGAKYVDGLNLASTAFNAPITTTSTHASAHANFFPMAMGVVPADRVSAVMTLLKTKRMACSVYGAQYLLEALFDGGEDDYAIGLMADNDPAYRNHWKNMIAAGSTMTMESWDNSQKANIDWNHAWGAAPADIIPRYVLGLKPLTAGYGQVQIKPQVGTGNGTAGLASVSGKIPTLRGPVSITVENSPTSYKLRLKTPGNMTARVLIPAKGLANPVLVVDGAVTAAKAEDGHLVLENLVAGQHAIWLSGTASPDAAVLRENWNAAMFGDDASNPAISGDSADPDNDGYPTSAEYAAGTDPANATSFPPDGDQLDDAWEIFHFGNTAAQSDNGDPDGDGTSNFTEQRLGLDPMNGSSRFAATIEGVMLKWPGVAGVTFTIQRSPENLSWHDLFTQPGQGGTNTYVDPAPLLGTAFYRVRLEP